MQKTPEQIMQETLKEIYQLTDLEAQALMNQQPFTAIGRKFMEKILTQECNDQINKEKTVVGINFDYRIRIQCLKQLIKKITTLTSS